jgi:hypothetical protein
VLCNREKKKKGENAVKSRKALECPRRGAIGGSRHARENSPGGGASSQENTSAGRVEGRRKSSRRVAFRSRARVLDDSLGFDLDNLDFGDALDGLDDDGGLHDHDDGLRGH